jgi:hypothetical protein
VSNDLAITINHRVTLSHETLSALGRMVDRVIDALRADNDKVEPHPASFGKPAPAPTAEPAASQKTAIPAADAPADKGEAPRVAPSATAAGSEPIVEALKPPPPVVYANRTAPRQQMLWKAYALDGQSIERITVALNELPGGPITAVEIVAWIGALNLKRTPKAEAAINGTGTPPAPTPKPAPLPPARVATPIVSRPSGAIIASDARKEILTRDWPTTRPRREILAEINALPGPPMSMSYADALASKLGLRRPAAATLPQDTPATPVRPDTMAEQRDACPTVDWEAARQWAAHNKVSVPEGTSRASARIIINDARRRMALPQWTIVETRARNEPLPAPHVGGSDHRVSA